MESQIVSEQPETITEIESHTVTQKIQSSKPDKIMEETEEESDGEVEQHKPIEVEDDESLPNQTPISLDSGDQSEEVEVSPNNGHDVVTSELINTSEYGNEIVDDIISEAISRVNDLAPEEDEEIEEQEEQRQVEQEFLEQEQEELELETEEMEQLIEQQLDEPVEIQPDFSGDVGDAGIYETVEPEQVDPDSEEPSSKSDPIDEPSLTEDAGAPLSVEPVEEETGENEAEPEPAAQKTETSTSGGKKKNRKKKGKKGGGGGGGGGNGN